MIDGTALVLLGTLVLVAICRTVLRSQYEKGWHAGRLDLIREQHADELKRWLLRPWRDQDYDAHLRAERQRILRSVPGAHIFDQDVDA